MLRNIREPTATGNGVTKLFTVDLTVDYPRAPNSFSGLKEPI